MTECDKAELKVEELTAALKWVVDTGVVASGDGKTRRADGNWAVTGYSEAGCGCCSGGTMVPPDDIKQTLDSVFGA